MPEELPRGWVKTILGEVCAINPRTQFESFPPDETEVSFVPMAAVEEESGRLDASQIRPLRAVKKGYTHFKEYDVIFAKITPCMENGKIALATGLKNGLAYGSTEFIVLRCYEGLLPRFLLYFLLQPSLRQAAERQMSGAVGQKRVPSNYLFNYEFLLPPTHEQERIVAKLDAALSGLERAEIAARRAQERLKRYRSAVLNAAVTGELTSKWRESRLTDRAAKAETGEALLQRLLAARRDHWEETKLRRRNSASKSVITQYSEPAEPRTEHLSELPKGWVWASLDQLLFHITDGDHQPPPKSEHGVPLLVIGNISSGKLDFTNTRFVPTAYAIAVDELRKPARGDILYSLVGSFGIAVKVDTDQEFCIQRHLAILRPHHLSPTGYIHLALNSQSTFLQAAAVATGTAQKTVPLAGLRKIAIPLPPLDEQAEIVSEVESRLSAADQLALTLEQQLIRSRATRRSLLRDAFTGRLVSQNSNDEPASMLLEGIRNRKVQIKESHKQSRQGLGVERKRRSDSMQKQWLLPESLSIAWENIGRKADARRLFDEAGFDTDHVVQFYEALRATPEVLTAFQEATQRQRQPLKPAKFSSRKETVRKGSFRLIELWLEDFKNLKNYTIRFDPVHSLDVVLGWNSTGKSNLFEALVIIFRDLHEWWEKNRWPDKPMNGYRLNYEIDEHTVEVTWRPGLMKRPELKKGPIARDVKGTIKLQPIKREMLTLPRFIFGYYSGPTNRLAEHFLPMKQAHYARLREANADDAETLAKLLEQRRFFCAETHHAKYVLLAFSYKDDPKISKFLKDRLRILGFESALFVIRKPRWARPGTKAEDFWGAKGIMRRVMERLRRYAIAPMVLDETVSYGYRSTTEQHYYFFLPDLESLHSFAAEYEDARTFFLALESTDFSELIYDVKIQVRIEANNVEQIPITFHQLSEGEQQLLMVLGLMRFTKSHQSLVLLDEPDTHLNPHWSVDYLKDLTRVMSDNALVSPEQQSSQILMATHDPLVIASLVKEQIHLLNRDPQTGACRWTPANINPRGLGFTGILTSEMFGFRSDLDPETLADLDNRVRLVAKEGALTNQESEDLEKIDKRLAEAGFSKAFSDPYYAAFVRAWGRRYSDLMAGEQFLTPEKKQEVDRIASEVLKEAVAEVEKEVTS